ncbi:protein DGS1, mitochondrial-like isoform X2 [Hordeum vulgare subsp. vulgare]|uniref:protein DGS1, mitochondrial-like isoform X2 n=1 Tax=Hordeum vulgare subsp. vulgare TaxID=112509 RepID=UPI001D1A5A75|nr:protein DGS1, mitochondrial-like isoform X2 [Hordeum vulgare subsp. vulgare]
MCRVKPGHRFVTSEDPAPPTEAMPPLRIRELPCRSGPVNHAAGAPTAPTRGWDFLFNRLFGGRRRPALPLSVHSSVELSAWDIYKMPIGCVILEEIMQRTLSYLRTIQESLYYWKSRARGSNSQQIYFMIFERGPSAFVETTCQRLTRLGNNGGQQSLLNSAKAMISTNIDVLMSIERCLATFLAEVYWKADICKVGLKGSHRESLYALCIVLNHVFPKLEELHRKEREGQTLIFRHVGNPSELQFKRLPEVDINSSLWTERFSESAIGLIYQNLEKLDSYVSSLLSRHKKPTHMALYWLPYTCGAIGFSLCSVWLLRHSSLMASSDIDNLVRHAKESITRFWSDPVEPIVSVGEEPFEAMTLADRPAMEKQYAGQAEKSLRRILLSFSETPPKEIVPQHASGEVMMEITRSILELDQVVKENKLDLQEAIWDLDPILKASKTSVALLAFGLPLLLVFLVRTRAQSVGGRGSIARLLVVAERRFLEYKKSSVNGEADEVMWKLGLTLYSLDRLYEAVELHGNGTDEWTWLKEYIFCLAKPGVSMSDKLAALSHVKDMYDCLFPSPSL